MICRVNELRFCTEFSSTASLSFFVGEIFRKWRKLCNNQACCDASEREEQSWCFSQFIHIQFDSFFFALTNFFVSFLGNFLKTFIEKIY